jgi:hypothetical protein
MELLYYMTAPVLFIATKTDPILREKGSSLCGHPLPNDDCPDNTCVGNISFSESVIRSIQPDDQAVVTGKIEKVGKPVITLNVGGNKIFAQLDNRVSPQGEPPAAGTEGRFKIVRVPIDKSKWYRYDLEFVVGRKFWKFYAPFVVKNVCFYKVGSETRYWRNTGRGHPLTRSTTNDDVIFGLPMI